MVVVAVAGGTGSVGRTIVDALKADGKYDVIVLTRKVPEKDTGVLTIAVDYDNIDSLTKILDENNIHTIISTIVMRDPVVAQSEIRLIAAATKSSSTKRFVASNWGMGTPLNESLRLPSNAFRDESIAALRKSGLEWTHFVNGFFLDYYGMPHVETYLTPVVFVVDIANKTAALPGSTGDEKITLTYTKDLAKFVVAALGLSKWHEEFHCYSEQTTYGHVVRVAEEAIGSKFDVTYDSIEKLQRGEITELPSHTFVYQFFPKPMLVKLMSVFGLWVATNVMDVPKEGSLNKMFPDIATTSVEEVVGAWKGK